MMTHVFIGTIVGAGLGFGGHKLAGCSTGACPLTSNPFVSTLHGMVMGVLIAISFR